MVSLAEINRAKDELVLAQDALDFADSDFIETAVYQQKIAELRLNNLIKRAKKEGLDNMVPFPTTEKELSWQEKNVMDCIGQAGIVLALVFGLTTILIQAGIWLGWW